jgi:thiamine-phosphate pyrophosphorylase
MRPLARPSRKLRPSPARIYIALMKMKSPADCRLYAFVDTAYLRGRPPEAVAQALCDGGADIIQLRAKQSRPMEVQRMAERVLSVTREHSVPLVVNDYLEVAQSVGAEFCHLGQDDFFDADYSLVSQLPGGPARPGIGLSTHAPDQAQRAIAAGPAYIAIGPVYATPTKPAARPVGLDYVRWAAEHVRVPWFAIGGINLQTIDAVLEAGARRVCVVSAILHQQDVAAACREFKRRLE